MSFTRGRNAHAVHELHCQPLAKHRRILRVIPKDHAFQSQEFLILEVVEWNGQPRFDPASAAASTRANTYLFGLNITTAKDPVEVGRVMRVFGEMDFQA